MSETDQNAHQTPPPPPTSQAPAPGAVDQRARAFTIGGFISGGLALLFLPILLGPIGIGLGFAGYRKGDPKGKVAMYVSIATTIIGIVMGLLVLNSSAVT